jgi:pimeloyl-ACP methyl ester carboxylesterase
VLIIQLASIAYLIGLLTSFRDSDLWVIVELSLLLWDVLSWAICRKYKHLNARVHKVYRWYAKLWKSTGLHCVWIIVGIVHRDQMDFVKAYIYVKVVYMSIGLLFVLVRVKYPSESTYPAIFDLDVGKQFTGFHVVNRSIFPAPQPSYDSSAFKGELFWISMSVHSLSTSSDDNLEKIPCLFLRPKSEIRFVMLYAHGNEEDLGNIYQMLCVLSNLLESVAIIAVEYPGYGIYQGFGKCTESRLLKTLETAYIFIRNDLNVPKENIIICGRSIGTYAASRVAKLFEPCALILISPFAVMEHVASRFIGRFLAKYILGNRFSTLEIIREASTPLLIIHGEKDELIPVEHAKFLYKQAWKIPENQKFIHISSAMTHNKIDFIQDLSDPISKFIKIFSNEPISNSEYFIHLITSNLHG